MVGDKAPQKKKLDMGYSKLYTPMVFKVPPGGTNWIGVGFHIKLPLRTEMVVKTRLNFQPMGLNVGNPRYKSNTELTRLITNNTQCIQRGMHCLSPICCCCSPDYLKLRFRCTQRLDVRIL